MQKQWPSSMPKFPSRKLFLHIPNYDRLGIGMVVTLGWKEAAFLSIVASTLLATRGSDAEEAAQTLGASSWQVFSRVTWPLLWRGLAPAVIATSPAPTSPP